MGSILIYAIESSICLTLLWVFYEIALKNLKYVYLGNTSTTEGQHTNCPKCGTTVTTRTGYSTRIMNLNEDGKCSRCGNYIYRYFTLPSREGD